MSALGGVRNSSNDLPYFLFLFFGAFLLTKRSTEIVTYLDFHSTKRAWWRGDSWSRASDPIQMYINRYIIVQLLLTLILPYDCLRESLNI